MLTSRNRLIRSVVLAAVVAAALAVASCGDDDEPSAGTDARNEQPAQTTDVDTSEIPETPPVESPHPVTSDIKKLRRAFLADDVPGICKYMTSSAKTSAGIAVHSEPTTCERDVRKLFKTIEKGGGFEHEGEPRVTGMAIDPGGHARALMSLGQQLIEVPMAKTGGEWKLDSFFGTRTADAERFVKQVRQRRFPAAVPANALGDTRVKVRDAAGKPCPELSDKQFPQLSGGCEIHAVSRQPLDLSVLTVFGDFPFDPCTISYRVLADRQGRTWTDTFDAAGDPKKTACGDVNACFTKSGTSVPWKGRLRSDGKGGFIHRMNMCLNTCVGTFTGDLVMHMKPDGKGWRTEPSNGGGLTGFRFEGPLSIQANGIEIEGGGAPSI